jgi:hypothetical protein
MLLRLLTIGWHQLVLHLTVFDPAKTKQRQLAQQVKIKELLDDLVVPLTSERVATKCKFDASKRRIMMTSVVLRVRGLGLAEITCFSCQMDLIIAFSIVSIVLYNTLNR